MSKPQHHWLVTFCLGAAAFAIELGLQVSGYTNPALASALFVAGAVLLAISFWIWCRQRGWLHAQVAALVTDPRPNWQYHEAMDYIADRFGLANEEDIDKKYTNVLGLLTRHAIAGKIHVWGKRISSDGPELVTREIPVEEWRNREPLIWACLPTSREAQTRSIIDPPDDYQFTALHVNATEIKAINWKSENARLYT